MNGGRATRLFSHSASSLDQVRQKAGVNSLSVGVLSADIIEVVFACISVLSDARQTGMLWEGIIFALRNALSLVFVSFL